MESNIKNIISDPKFPEMLRAARIKAGLSLADLSKRIDYIVSRQAIAKYEKGIMKPSEDVLKKIMQVIDIKITSHEADYYHMPEFRYDFKEVKEMRALCPPEISDEIQETVNYCKKMTIRNKVDENNLNCGLMRRKKWYRESLEKPHYESFKESKKDIVLRNEKNLNHKQLLAIELIISEKMQNYICLENLLNRELKFDLQYPTLDLDYELRFDPIYASEILRKLWKLGDAPIYNLLSLLEEKGIKVFSLELPFDFNSISGKYKEYPFIVVNSRLSAEKVRFNAVKELAFILAGINNEEINQAILDKFAISFLLPKKVLTDYLIPVGRKIALGELNEIKMRYGISIRDLMKYALDINLITERRYRSFRELVFEKTWQSNEPADNIPNEYPYRFDRLLNYSVASGIFSMEKAASFANTSLDKIKSKIGVIF